jgi:hypothetical protein
MTSSDMRTHRIDGKRRYTAVARGLRGRSEGGEVSESQLLGASDWSWLATARGSARRRCLRRVSLVDGRAWNLQQTETQRSEWVPTLKNTSTDYTSLCCLLKRALKNKDPSHPTTPARKSFKPIVQRRSCCKVRLPRRWGNATWHFSVHLFPPWLSVP